MTRLFGCQLSDEHAPMMPCRPIADGIWHPDSYEEGSGRNEFAEGFSPRAEESLSTAHSTGGHVLLASAGVQRV